MREVFDIIIIGGGVGGYTAGLKAAELGASVALVEQGEIGGTCLNVGCIPTKALLESCRILRQARDSQVYGVQTQGAAPDTQAMVQRSQAIVSTLRKGVEDLLLKRNIEVIRGKGRLLASNRLEVDRRKEKISLEARSVILATGSSWLALPGVTIDGEGIITSDHAVKLKSIPASVVIVGGGAVGCEFAEIYRALGSQVTLVEMMEHLMPGEDPELARRLEVALKRKGVKVLTSSKVAGVDKSDGLVRLHLEEGQSLDADQVLVGIGRRPNTEHLGLKEVGIRLDGHAIETDGRMRTSIRSVFAVGDVTGKHLLAHVALAQGAVAAENACGGSVEISYRAVPRCVYTHPEFAAVGLGEREAQAQGVEASVHRVRLGQVGRALTMGETLGMAKVVYQTRSGEILGFHALAPHASEIVAEMAVAVEKRMTVGDIAQIIHPHPTMSELVRECVEAARSDLDRRGPAW